MNRTLRLLAVATLVAGTVSTVLVAPAGAATTVLSNQASPSGYPVGTAVFDVATLGQTVNPTGTLTFLLFGPDNATCSGPPIFTSTKAVSGNGNYTSDSFPTRAAGTYRWIVRYAGDAANTPDATACSDPAGVVMIGRRNPTLNVDAAPLSPTGTLTSTAILGNGAGPSGPTGTLTFNLYGPDNLVCAGPPIATTTRAVAGNGNYTSDPFTPTAGGTYQWVTSYSGDANNFAASTICSDPAGTEVVVPRLLTPTLSLAVPPAARRGEAVRATGSLAGGVVPSGTLTFTLHDPGDSACSAPPVSRWSVAVSGNGSYTSAPFTLPGPGTYRWVVRYGGDLAHVPVATTCGQRDSATAVAQVVGDYDGDGDTDVAIYRPSNGGWYPKGIGSIVWGVLGDVPVSGDYDGDGDTDVAVYRPSTGGWYLKDIGSIAWGGVPGDIPVPGDYDGDGDTDVAVYRPATGGWYLKDIGSIAWGGVPGDVPVPGDYDGDGDTDVAIYRPSNGGWYPKGIGEAVWGVLGDIPVPGDYNGDGQTDMATYRSSDGGWYLAGLGRVSWGGVVGDIPLSLPSVLTRLVALPLP